MRSLIAGNRYLSPAFRFGEFEYTKPAMYRDHVIYSFQTKQPGESDLTTISHVRDVQLPT